MNVWIHVFIVVGGCLQAAGSAMNGQLYKSLRNPWLAGLVSFGLIAAFFLCMTAVVARPLPSAADVQRMPWCAPLAGLVGAVAVYAGLKFVGTVGAGSYTGLNVTAALATSIVIDHFGLLRMAPHPASLWRIVGAGLMVGGVTLTSKF